MKKYISIIMLSVILAAFSACSEKNTDNSSNADVTTESTEAASNENDITTTITTTVSTEPTTETQTDIGVILDDEYENSYFTLSISSEWTFRRDGSTIWFDIPSHSASLHIWGAPTDLTYSNNKDFVQYWVNDSLKIGMSSEACNYNGNYFAKGYFENNDSTYYVCKQGDILTFFEFYLSENGNNEELISEILSNIKLKDLNTDTSTDELNQTILETPTEKQTSSSISLGKQNALEEAKDYLKYSSFSYEGLIEQLEYEKYSYDEAVYAVNNCGANWDEQALLSAKNYIEYSGFSYQGLVEQLEYEKFTYQQAVYGADNCGANWNAEAAESAENYLKYSSFSRQELLEQLLYEGFTQEQAEYGVQSVGY